MSKFLDSTGLTYLWGKITDAINSHYVTAGKQSGTNLGTKATAEGYNTTASGDYSHAEGQAKAIGIAAHAEGFGTANSIGGYNVGANGDYSHAEGLNTC